MSGITNPAEPFFKDGLWGWVTNAWKKLVATAGGALHIQFAGQEADVEVKQTAAADLTPGVCGWVGGAWQKLPLLFGWSGKMEISVTESDSTAPEETLQSGNVPGGEIWVLQSVAAYDANTNPTRVVISVASGTASSFLVDEAGAGADRYTTWEGSVVMAPGDHLKVVFVGVANNDDVGLIGWGYKMLIAE